MNAPSNHLKARETPYVPLFSKNFIEHKMKKNIEKAWQVS
jgi:hypothetical protein